MSPCMWHRTPSGCCNVAITFQSFCVSWESEDSLWSRQMAAVVKSSKQRYYRISAPFAHFCWSVEDCNVAIIRLAIVDEQIPPHFPKMAAGGTYRKQRADKVFPYWFCVSWKNATLRLIGICFCNRRNHKPLHPPSLSVLQYPIRNRTTPPADQPTRLSIFP